MANLRIPYESFKAQIIATCPGIAFVSMWNAQAKNLMGEHPSQWPFAVPAVFIEFLNPMKYTQMTNGLQLLEALNIRLHFVNTFFNATNGIDVLEEDPGQFDLIESVFAALDGFQTEGCVCCVRTGQGADYDHTDVEHYWCDFVSNYVDASRLRPVGGVEWAVSPRILDIIITPWDDNLLIQDDGGPIYTDEEGWLLYEAGENRTPLGPDLLPVNA